MYYSGPSGYKAARLALSPTSSSALRQYAVVEGRPYFPNLHVDPSDETSMVDVARAVVDAYYSDAIQSKEDDGNTDTSNDECVVVSRICGGLTNALYKIDFPKTTATTNTTNITLTSTASSDSLSVLIRIFGGDGMIDRDVECATFARLCSGSSSLYATNNNNNNDVDTPQSPVHNINNVNNPKCQYTKKAKVSVVHPHLDMIGRFANGRIETFLENRIPSTLYDYHVGTDNNSNGEELMKEVAKCVARLHYGFKIPHYYLEKPGNSSSSNKDEVTTVDGDEDRTKIEEECAVLPPTPGLWNVLSLWIAELDDALSNSDGFNEIDDWLVLIHRAVFDNTNTTLDTMSKNDIISNLRREAAWLQTTVQTLCPDAAVAFTHNDLCMANILLDGNHQRQNNTTSTTTAATTATKKNNNKDPCIIDYEYGSVNYTMYDIANFFCELCGGNENGIPDLTLYPTVERQELFLREYLDEKYKMLRDGNEKNNYASSKLQQKNITSTVLLELLSQIAYFQMGSNLLWGIWGILQACAEMKEEGYCAENAKLRLDGTLDVNSFDNLRYGMNRLRNYRVCKKKRENCKLFNTHG